jgi:hypothetical protein
MKTTTLMLCLMAGLMTSGCVFHHEAVRHREPEQTRPEGVADARPADAAGIAGTAR